MIIFGEISNETLIAVMLVASMLMTIFFGVLYFGIHRKKSVLMLFLANAFQFV